uniref:Fibronectin type-III domain-containing protein n=1 Tax=Esox lucius TaxID=8010 RepID=A0A6Q2Y5D8_ESOLU
MVKVSPATAPPLPARYPPLHCGQQYNLTVTALGGSCNSSHSHVTVQSGPCAPGNLHTNLQCITNSTSLMWDKSPGALQYLATGRSASGHVTSCNSSDTYCDLTGLQCGQVYNVSVHSADTVCRSIQTVRSDLQTALCPPQNVDAQVLCASGSMLVTWDPDTDAQFFLLDAVTEAGSSHSCNTTANQCSISNLTCGESFSVQVTAVRGGCHSLPSQAVNVSSAPCMPTGVNGSQNCVANSAWVSWVPALGADSYTVTADGAGGYNSSCSTSGSTCEVPDLACGVRYTFYVTASNGHCEGPRSVTFSIETAPCNLSSIMAYTQCHSSSIQVLWGPGGKLSTNHGYIVMAEASDHSVLTCNSSATSCDLEGARCDLQYSVIVAVSSDTCSSLRSPPYRVTMEPCPPQDVVIKSSCESRGVHVSWIPSPVAEAYVMTAVGGNGDVLSCNSSTNNCSLSGLRCSQQYNISVFASNQNCSSTASQNVTFNTVPCKPDGVSVSVQCANQSAQLSWRVRAGAEGYWGSAQAEDGSRLYCESTGTSCTIEGLECGAQYNFTVQASDGTCNSSFSEPLPAGAAPCPPENMRVTTLPMQNQAQYLRASWTNVTCPNVQYLLEVTGCILGDSQSQFELASYWTDTSFFELLLPCGSSYNATVKSSNSAGESAPSVAVNGTTAPCPPQQVTFTGSISSATISWNASVYATDYTVYDISSGVWTQVCSTVQLSCSLTNISYSNLEVTASNAAGESEPTRAISVHLSRRRRDLSGGEISSVTGLAQPEVQVTVKTPNTLLVDWSPVEGATYYSLVVQEQRPRPRHAGRPAPDTNRVRPERRRH